jgi:hypothetical protein
MTTSDKFTPRTKHIALKYHHFWSHVRNRHREIIYCPTEDQKADLRTKPLADAAFSDSDKPRRASPSQDIQLRYSIPRDGTNFYSKEFWGQLDQKRGERSVGYRFTEKQILHKPHELIIVDLSLRPVHRHQ